MSEYSIQELSELTSLPRRTIHFYVQQGLLPPPESAGVGTRYSEVHLLCLKLIPHLKNKGLKLDDIRDLLKKLDEQQLQELFDQLDKPAAPTATVLPVSQPFSHYQLPAGMTLIVPASLTPSERKKLTEILKNISDLFSEP